MISEQKILIDVKINDKSNDKIDLEKRCFSHIKFNF